MLIFFHISEVLLAYKFERDSLSFRSLLLSGPYVLVMTLALLEYYISLNFLFPNKKAIMLQYLYWPGLLGVIIGEIIRKTAWLTARISFSHNVRTHREPGHTLITTGVYAWSRHPAYFGWFIWAVSTQILLANSTSFIAFTFLSWHFFHDRIPYEENFLVCFFGNAYIRYREITPTRIPGIP